MEPPPGQISLTYGYQPFVYNEFCCEVCSRSFANLSQLIAHRRSHSNERPFVCGECGMGYKSYNSLPKHIERAHSSSTSAASEARRAQATFVCRECGLKFCRELGFVRHRCMRAKGLRGGGSGRLGCPYCDRVFKARHSLINHLPVHTGERLYACTYCDRQFAHPSSLATHLKVHTGRRPYVCEFCFATFVDPHILARHRSRAHTNTDKPFYCRQCSQSFAQSSHLVSHRLLHTADGDCSPHLCQMCDLDFASLPELERHRRLIHTPDTKQKRPPPATLYHCPLCPRRFTRLHYLLKHKRGVHRADYPYACRHCARSFSNMSSLVGHEILHSGEAGGEETPEEEDGTACQHCDQIFPTRASCLRHRGYTLRKVHRFIVYIPLCYMIRPDEVPPHNTT